MCAKKSNTNPKTVPTIWMTRLMLVISLIISLVVCAACAAKPMDTTLLSHPQAYLVPTSALAAAAATPPEPITANPEVIIGISLDPVADSQDLLGAGASDYIQTHNNVRIIEQPASLGLVSQLEAVDQLISQSADAIIILPVDERVLVPIAARCDARGIPLILLDPPADGQSDESHQAIEQAVSAVKSQPD